MTASKSTRQAIVNAFTQAPNSTIEEMMRLLGLDPTIKRERQRMSVSVSTLKGEGYLDSTPVYGSKMHRYRVVKPLAKTKMGRKPSKPSTKHIKPVPAAALATPEVRTKHPAPGATVDLMPAIDLIASTVATMLQKSLSDKLQQVVHDQVQAAISLASQQIAASQALSQATAAAPIEHQAPPEKLPPIEVAVKPKESTTIPAVAPRVTVVGLLPGQVDMIKREFGNELHLSFVGKEKNDSDRLRHLCQSSGHVLSMSNFMNHSLESIVKAHAKNHIRIVGGMSTLRDNLTAIYVNGANHKQGPLNGRH